jgi:HprK-related kinase A
VSSPETPPLERDDAPTRYYRVGDVPIAVRSDFDEALDDFERLYGSFRADQAPADAIVMEARADARTVFGRRRYSIYGDGLRIFGNRKAAEVFPYLEWGINWRVVQRHGRFLQLHAATLGRAGRTMLFAGNSGCGKSTLAAVLLARGWKYFGDEFALIEAETMRVRPFPKALCVKSGSFDLVRQLDLPLFRRRHYSKDFKGPVGYIDPRSRDAVATEPAAVDYIIFPQYSPDRVPDVVPLPRAAAAFELARCTFNPGDFGPRFMPLLCEFVRRAACLRLFTGDPEETGQCLESIRNI